MTEEQKNDLMQEAIKRYPKGTVFNSLGGNNNVIVDDPITFHWNGTQIEGSKNRGCSKDCQIYRHNGGDPRWASITTPGKSPEISINDFIYF